MSVSSRRALLGTGSAALALALTVPTAALADPGNGGGNGNGKGPKASPSASTTTSPTATRAPQQGSGGTGASKAPKPSKSPKPKASRTPQPAAGKPSSAAPQQPGTRPTHGADPRGNNGTIKIDGEAFDDGRGNEPHVGCRFSVDFYGFDAGQTADITFTGQAPTRTGTLLAQQAVPISDDAAGGGQDRDATLVYTAQQLGLAGVAPSRNGWHVKVAVDVLQAPGGAKQKVFWLQCAPTATTPAPGLAALPTVSPTPTQPPAAGSGGTTVDLASPSPSVSPAVAGPGAAGTQELPPALGSGGVTLDATPTPAPSLRAQGIGGRILGGALPFTGSPVGALLVLGGGALAAGAASVVAGRRRAAQGS